MEHLVYSLNSVLPLFVLVALGYFLRRKGIIQESFVTAGTKIGFQAALPVLLFQQVAQADLTTVFNPWLVAFAICAILATVLLLCLLIPLFVKGNPQRGAMIQGIYRGNFAILGVRWPSTCSERPGPLLPLCCCPLPFRCTTCWQ